MSKNRHSRRSFLRGAALGAAAVTINPILSRRAFGANPGIPGRFLVVVNLLGGNDGLNMVVPAHLTPYVDRRPNINLVTNLPAGEVLHDLDGSFKLHYELGTVKSCWDDGDVHIVHKVSYPNPNQSHFTSQDIYSQGVRGENTDGRGWLGRFADGYCNDPIEPLGVISVGLGRRRDFESDVTAPLILNNIETFRVDPDNELAGQFPGDSALRELTVRNTIDTDPVPPEDPALAIFNTNKLAYDLVDRVRTETADWTDPGTYPNTTLGRYLKTVSQLLYAQSSFGTKVFYTGMGGFDTHSGQHSGTGGQNRHAALMAQMDGALGAFIADMKAKNKWNDCCIVIISEFGRRNFENGSIGTDHGWGNPFIVLGGRVNGRLTVGGGFTGEVLEADVAAPNNQLPFGYDFRDIYGNIVMNHLGMPTVTDLFPDPSYNPAFNDIGVF